MKRKKYFLLAGCFFALFAALLVVVLNVDVAAIGPEGTRVGLSSLNKAVHDAVGVHLNWYTITDYLGYGALLVAALFAALGCAQMIKRRGFAKVDREILALGGLYVALLAIYVFFEKVIVNYRPIIMPDETAPEASFPSSHTMLACTILGSTILVLRKYVKNPPLRIALQAACAAAMAVLVIGRFYSGAHWLTDILGGLLISAALLSLFMGVKIALCARKRY